MGIQFIDLKAQYQLIKDEINLQINEVLESGQYILGHKVDELEGELASFCKVSHAIGVADGTKAILIALMALGVGLGDEVIVPSFTFIATASQALLLGAKIIFVDIDPKTFNLDPAKLENAITSKTKAIIPVGIFGQSPDMCKINQIANKHNIPVIEDAAQSFGSRVQTGDRSCSLATIACTSFFPSKPLGCYGDGGACFTCDDELAQRIRFIRVHGQDSRYHHAMLGVNGRLDTIQAAILLVKLKIFARELEMRSAIAKRYDDALGDYCQTPYIQDGFTHIYAQYSILVNNRDAFVANMTSKNIPTAIHYPIPLHQQPILQSHYHGQDLSVSEDIAKRVVSLPMHPYLDPDTQDHIINSAIESIACSI